MSLPSDIDKLRAEQILAVMEEGIATGAPDWKQVNADIYRYAFGKRILGARDIRVDTPQGLNKFIKEMAHDKSVAMAELRTIIAERIAISESFGEPFGEKALPAQFLKTIEAMQKQDAQRKLG